MSAFKRINKGDVVTLPYLANKDYLLSILDSLSGSFVILNGKYITDSFDPENSPITNGQYDRLVYESINNTFYQAFDLYRLDESSKIKSNNYESSSAYRPSGSYYEFGKIGQIQKSFPTGSGAEIKVLKIDKTVFGNGVHIGSFNLSSQKYSIIDDSRNNLIDIYSGSSTHVGNIFYEQGLVIITNPDYQQILPIPPYVKNKRYVFYQESASKTMTPLTEADPRYGMLLTESITFSGSNYNMFSTSSGGNILFSGSIPGRYETTYRIKSQISSSLSPYLDSNYGKLTVDVISTLYYYNNATSSIFQKTGCGTGGTGSAVTYNVPYGTFSSSISQLDADTQASASIAANGQSYANVNGFCIYRNEIQSGSFIKNDCGSGGSGSLYVYYVYPGEFTSSVSISDANNIASASVAANGQTYANKYGTCTYYNSIISASFQKNDCNPFYTGSTVVFTVSGGVFSSSVSQAVANVSASNYLYANGQSYANSNGVCSSNGMVNVQWLDWQVGNVFYTDCNLTVTKYSPASNPSGVIVVNSFIAETGSFTASIGDRLVINAFGVDPWTTGSIGSSSMHLNVYGQSSSYQATDISGSSLVSDIVLSNINDLYIGAYTMFIPTASSEVKMAISGSITTNINQFRADLVTGTPFLSMSMYMTGLWNNGTYSGSWYYQYTFASGSSTSGYVTPYDSASNSPLSASYSIVKIDSGSQVFGGMGESGWSTGNTPLLILSNPLP